MNNKSINYNNNNNIKEKKNLYNSVLKKEKKIDLNNNQLNNNNNFNRSYINNNKKEPQISHDNKFHNFNIKSNQDKLEIKVNESKQLNSKINYKNENKEKINNLQQNNQISQMKCKTQIIKKKARPGKSPFRNKETEEERQKREKKEKEQKDIRDKLQCYLCFGKAIKARMCKNCKKIACDQCIRNMLFKSGKCLNCNRESTLEDIITIPWMEDLTLFFINNIDNYQNQLIRNINNENDEEQKKKDESNNNFQNNFKENDKNVEDLNNEDVQYCNIHRDKKIEYFCLPCNEYFCSKCLMFTNQEVIAKHQKHKIIDIGKLKKYNINEAIKEYKILQNSSNNLDNLLICCRDKIKEIEINKIRLNDILENIKKEKDKKFEEEIKELNELIEKIKKKKENIENSIDSVPNSFNNIVEREDYGQGEQILEELKKLNHKFEKNEEFERKINCFTNNLCVDWFKSESINFSLPNEGKYVEELIFLEKDLDFIKDHPSKLKAQLLGGNIIFIFSIEIGDEYYKKHHPKFYVHFSFKNEENSHLYSIFYGDVYSNGNEILTSELNFETVKEIILNKKCFDLKMNVIKSYYK